MGCLRCDKSTDGKILTDIGDHKSCELEFKNRIAKSKCKYCGKNIDPDSHRVSCGCGMKYKNYPGT